MTEASVCTTSSATGSTGYKQRKSKLFKISAGFFDGKHESTRIAFCRAENVRQAKAIAEHHYSLSEEMKDFCCYGAFYSFGKGCMMTLNIIEAAQSSAEMDSENQMFLARL